MSNRRSHGMAKKRDQKNARTLLVANAALGTLTFIVEYTKRMRAVVNLAWDDLDGCDPQVIREHRELLIPHFRGFFHLDEHSEERTVEDLDRLMTGLILACES